MSSVNTSSNRSNPAVGEVPVQRHKPVDVQRLLGRQRHARAQLLTLTAQGREACA
jgi:hypothetical protein